MSDKYFSLRDAEAGEHIATLKVPNGPDEKNTLEMKINDACNEHFDVVSCTVKSMSNGSRRDATDVLIETIDDESDDVIRKLELATTWIY